MMEGRSVVNSVVYTAMIEEVIHRQVVEPDHDLHSVGLTGTEGPERRSSSRVVLVDLVFD